MANTKSAQKMIRVAAKRRIRNRSTRSAVKTHIGKAERLITTTSGDDAVQAVNEAIRSLDKASEKGIIHKNNAARHKSRLMKKLNKAAS